MNYGIFLRPTGGRPALEAGDYRVFHDFLYGMDLALTYGQGNGPVVPGREVAAEKERPMALIRGLRVGQ
jgi:hypothetical protein